MKIVLWGVETHNKGAELMLYAILQEIERRHPDATVYIPYTRCKQGLDYVKTSLDFRYTPFSKFLYKVHAARILNILHLPSEWMSLTNIVRDADWFIDGSGFAFSDQFNIKDERVRMWQTMLNGLRNKDSKVVFLPQAYGPVEQPNTKKVLKLIGDKADVIMSREKVSYNYLKESGVIDMSKVSTYTDFTSLVEGVFPNSYKHLRDGICVIPNMKMIEKGSISYNEYIRLLSDIIEVSRDANRPIYLLNHEGKKDESLAYKCQESVGDKIEVVTGLNALEVKGLITSAYLVITSRFHGLASALNGCVPALATSWSHKYKELYNDYELDDFILPLDNLPSARKKVMSLLAEGKNREIRLHLSEQKPKIQAQTRAMWNEIWNLR